MAVNNNKIGLSGPRGYDYDFVDKLPDDCICKICHLALRKPVQTKCCGHRFCKECLDKANKSKAQPECPMDRKKLNLEEDLFPDKAAERWISSFLINCSSKGCEWQGELGNFYAHEQKCDYMNIKCSNEQCEIVKLRMEMTNHLEHECDWREVLCQYCKKTYKFRELEPHYLLECLAFPVRCPNACGEVMKREQVEVHISDKCSMSVVPCMYHRYGCDEEIQRKFMKEHIENTTNKHLKCISNYVLSTRADVDTLSTKSNSITSSLREAKRERIRTTNEVDRLGKKLKIIEINTNRRFQQLESDTSQRFQQLEKKVKRYYSFFVLMMLVMFVMIIII